MLARPDLLAGSNPAPPLNENRKLITGTDLSSTSQASIPPGERTRWISVAAAGQTATKARSSAPVQARNFRRIGSGP